tara:strand:- start:34 stop:711 length:678 start_codon:yes stop_codon:yes gene_type:complete
MRLTTKQLRQIIIEELASLMNENEEEFENRFAARRAAGFDDEIMSQLDSIESNGDYESYVSAHELAASLGSEERKLEFLEFQVEKDDMIPKYIEGSIRGIQHISPDRRIEHWYNQGVDLRGYEENPRQVEKEGEQFWEPLHITKQQFVDSEYRFLYQQLWSFNWESYPKREKYEIEMKGLESMFKAKIAKEIQKHIDSGEIMDREGDLYAKAAPIAQEIYRGLNL